MAHQTEHVVALHIPSVLGYEKVVVEAGGAFAREVGIDEGRVAGLQTALSEACLNAIEHGNREDPEVKVMVTLTANALGLQMDVDDWGPGFEVGATDPQIGEKIAGREAARGWGVFLIRRLVDDVWFEQAPGGGNRTRMMIYFQSKK